MVQIEDLKGMTFQAEQAGHTFQISGIDDDGNTVALTGTPAGVLLRPDNTDVALTCSVSGGVVSATLPANCYDVPGRFGLTIFITSGSSKTAIYAAVGTVTRTSSGTVAPGTSQSVVDLINAINAAVNSIPASYSALLADIAPTYSDSALYSVGQYAWYDGDLKRCIVPITTAESYTAAHWTSAVLGQDVSDLKSAFDKYGAANIAPIASSGTTGNLSVTRNGNEYTINGTSTSQLNYDIFQSTNSFPDGLAVGAEYLAGISGDNGIKLASFQYISGSWVVNYVEANSYQITKIDDNATGYLFRLIISAGTYTNAKVTPFLANTLTKQKIVEELTRFEDKTDKTNAALSRNGIEAIELIKGGLIPDNVSVGDAITLTPTPSDQWAYIVRSCSPGECYLIKATGQGNARCLAFTDSNNKAIYIGDYSYDTMIDVPEGASKMIVNAKISSGYYLYKNKLFEEISDEREELDYLVQSLETNGLFKSIDIIKHYYISNSTEEGESVDLTPKLSWAMSCAVVDVSSTDSFFVKGRSGSNWRIWSFVDSENKAIGDKGAENYTYGGRIIGVPTGAVKAIFNINTLYDSFVEKYVDPQRNSGWARLLSRKLENCLGSINNQSSQKSASKSGDYFICDDKPSTGSTTIIKGVELANGDILAYDGENYHRVEPKYAEDTDSGFFNRVYDVCVVGGGAGGVGAGYALKDSGLDVCIVDKNDALGGTHTVGGVTNFCPSPEPPFFKEKIYNVLAASQSCDVFTDANYYKTNEEYYKASADGSTWEKSPVADGMINFDSVQLSKIYASDLGKIDLKLKRQFEDVAEISNGTVSAITVKNLATGGTETIYARFFIDASADGVLARAAGANAYTGSDPKTRFNEAPIVDGYNGNQYALSGVDIGIRLLSDPNHTEDVSGIPSVDGTYASFNAQYFDYTNRSFYRLTADNGVAFSPQRFLELGDDAFYRTIKPNVMSWWKKSKTAYSWMQNYKFYSYAKMLGIRESYRIICDDMLVANDVTEKITSQTDLVTKKYVAISNWYFDIHCKSGELLSVMGLDQNEINKIQPYPYGIPIDCLFPVGLKNVVIGSRCLGASHLAAATCRVTKTMMCVGYAAGFVGEAYVKNNLSDMRNVNVGTIQTKVAIADTIDYLEDYCYPNDPFAN